MGRGRAGSQLRAVWPELLSRSVGPGVAAGCDRCLGAPSRIGSGSGEAQVVLLSGTLMGFTSMSGHGATSCG